MSNFLYEDNTTDDDTKAVKIICVYPHPLRQEEGTSQLAQ